MKKKNTEKAVVYTRTGSVPQNGPSSVLSTQVMMCEKYCRMNRLDVTEHFSEIRGGMTYPLSSGALMMAIEKCKQTGADLIISSWDRLTRNISHLAMIKECLNEAGVTVRVSVENVVFYEKIQAGIADFERRIRVDRIKAGINRKKEQVINSN